MKIKYLFLFLFLFVFSQNTVYSQSYAQDTVWTKVTDQVDGFYQVKFSNHDSIIVGHGYEMDMFYNALNGEEIMRIPGTDEVFFFDNDSKLLRINNLLNHFDIFDAKTFLLTDSLKNDGFTITQSPFANVSRNQSHFVSQIDMGFVVWNLQTKLVIKKKLFPNEPNLKSFSFSQVQFINNDSRIFGKIGKVFEDPSHPGDPNYYKNLSYFVAYNLNNLDSGDYFPYFRSYRLSSNNQIIAVATGDPTYGVEIYDFNTKQLLHRLPINGPSLTGIEFSPDDKYIVTANGPGLDCLNVWEVTTGTKLYGYTQTSFDNIDISSSGKFLVFSIGRKIKLLNTRFYGTPVPIIPVEITVLYPNPSNGEVNIDNIVTETIKIYNTIGVIQATITPINSESGIRFNVSNLPNGEYLISLEGKENKTYKLIINK